MKNIFKLAVFGIAAIAALSSCSKNEVVPSQKDIETKIIGKWKRIKLDGVEHSTNMRQIATFENGGKMYSTTTMTATGKSIWEFQAPFDYECIGNTVRSRLYFDDGTLRSEMQYEVQEINETAFKVRMFRTFSDGAYKDINTLVEYRRINADYSQDIIGLWEGVGMTGEETYGDANHRIEYRADGTYTYYDRSGEDWVPSANVGNEYNVDGDWLAFRWCPVAGADYEYERWDIDEIKEGTMKWSALREREDGTSYTTTFTWKKVENPDKPSWPEWFETSTPINKDFVDVLFFAGTNVGKEFDKDGNEVPNITLTEDQKAKIANECRNAWTLLCPDSVNFYAPYYHQGTMSAITNINLSLIALSVAGEEALKIFQYYMDNINDGRPFILAGYSQGAIMVKDILRSLTDEEYSYMKAAYMMGLGLNDEALNDPHIKPATGEFDKGVTISYNSAAGKEDIWEAILANTHYCINPVNWKTDDTPATFKYDGMELTNHIDPDTHVLFVDGFDFETHPVAFPGFPAGWTEHNLHLYEVKMYAPFLRKNIKDRAYR